MTNKSVVFALPCNHGYAKGFLGKFIQAYNHAIVNGWQVAVLEGDAVPHDFNRNELTRTFLNHTTAEWLLFIDDDVFPPANIVDMLQDDVDIVGCDVRNFMESKPVSTAVVLKECGTKAERKNLTERQEVLGVGTGCMGVNRRVVEKLENNWFRFEYDETGYRTTGEDYFFCQRVREAGFKIIYDPAFVCGHMKQVYIKGDNVVSSLLKGMNKV